MASSMASSGRSYTLKPKRSLLWTWFKRLTFGTALLVLVLVIAHAVWGWRAGVALEADLAAYRAAGEPILPSDFVGPAVPDEQNGAVALRALADRVDAKSDAYGQAERGNAFAFQLPLTAAERATLRQLAEENRSVLSDLPAALARPTVDWGISQQSPLLSNLDLNHLSTVRRLALVVTAAAVTAHEAGDDASALLGLSQVHAIGRAIDRQPLLIPHLVSLGLSAMAADAAVNMSPSLGVVQASDASPARAAPSLGPPDPRPASRAQVVGMIAALLDDADLRAGGRRGLRGERMVVVDAARSMGDGRLALNGLGVPTDGKRWAAAMSGYTLRPMANDSARLMAAQVSAAVKALDADDWPTCASGLPSRLPWESYVYRMRHLAAAILLPSIDAYCRQDYRAVATRRMAAVALAARLYALDHDGKLPPTLGDLVPRFLPAVPTDPLTVGKPLGYRPSGDRPMVYNVGENGRDDGGAEATPGMSSKTFRETGDDVRLLRHVPRWVEVGDDDRDAELRPEPAGPPAPGEVMVPL